MLHQIMPFLNIFSKGLLLYISTSFWVLHNLNAGDNLLFALFTHFWCKNYKKLGKNAHFFGLIPILAWKHSPKMIIFTTFFIILASKSCKNMQTMQRKILTGFKVHSTQILVKIYNIVFCFWPKNGHLYSTSKIAK